VRSGAKPPQLATMTSWLHSYQHAASRQLATAAKCRHCGTFDEAFISAVSDDPFSDGGSDGSGCCALADCAAWKVLACCHAVT
jgi:hypothetical protein